MSTSVSSLTGNFFPSAENGFTTTTSGSVASGAATVGLNSVAGYANGEVAVFVIDPTDPTKKQTFTGVIDTSGVQVTDVVWTAGTNQTHALGATVVDYATATHISMMTKGITQEHNQDGTHGAVTADSLTVDGAATHSSTLTQTGVATFATHIDINDSSTAIRDSSDNELLKFAKTASAVNEIEITNAATGGIPQIAATGGDTNISLYAKAKGTGHFLPGNPVAFLARRTTDQSGIVTGTTTKVQFATETYDLGGNFDNATNYNFVAPYDGIYHFSWSTCMDSIGTIYYSMLYINGSLYTSEFRFSNAVTDDLSSGGSCTVQMTAGQTADVRVQHNAGANRSLLGTTAGANYFSGYLVGRT